MPTKKTTKPAPLAKPATAKKAKVIVPLLAHDTWVTGVMIDAEAFTTTTGLTAMRVQYEVTRPRLYRGRNLFFQLNEQLTETIETLGEQFPDVDWFDEEALFTALGGIAVRLHVYVEQGRTDEDGNVYAARNRVVSVYAGGLRAVEEPGTQTVLPAEETATA